VEFLTSITPAEALRIIASFPLPEREHTAVDLDDALGRVAAADIIAGEDVPPFSRSLVDGYAVKVKDTYGARETSPAFAALNGEVRVGEIAQAKVSDGECVYVATGAMMPDGADGVVMQEYARPAQDVIEITRAVRTGENICFRGEDIERGRTIVKQGTRLSAFSIGVLAALGVIRINVYGRPRASIISSGNELVPAGMLPPPGKVRDINTHVITGLLCGYGCDVSASGIAHDSPDAIIEKLKGAGNADLILLSGGSSKGQSDFVVTAVEQLGGKVLFHGLNIKPGKPTIFATLGGIPVFGLPGHPVSCSMALLRLVLPLVERLRGEKEAMARTTRAMLGTNIPSSYGVEEYVRVRLHMREGVVTADPVFAKSSVISTLHESHGYVIVPEGQEGLEAGEQVEVYPFG
jgi:molybdopterin molybdotransferase